MLKKIVVSSVIITVIALFASSAFGVQHHIDITYGAMGPCPLPGVAPDSVVFYNADPAETLIVKIWNKTTGTVTEYTGLAPTDSAIHTIVAGDCEAKLFNADQTKQLFECMFAQCQVPTLTQWGIIGLVALIVASTIFIMLRRRKASVPA